MININATSLYNKLRMTKFTSRMKLLLIDKELKTEVSYSVAYQVYACMLHSTASA